MSKYTEGPWTQSHIESGVIISISAPCSDQHKDWYGGHVVCETVKQIDIPLISTAPELLEACQAFVDLYPAITEGNWRSVLQGLAARFRYTIAKVEGYTIAKAEGGE